MLGSVLLASFNCLKTLTIPTVAEDYVNFSVGKFCTTFAGTTFAGTTLLHIIHGINISSFLS
jgi:hypothetical protein